MEKSNRYLNYIFLIILFFIVLFFINTKVFATTGVITDTTVKIRSNPSIDSSILTLVSVDEKVEVLEKNGDWYKVKYNNYTGYIRNDLMKIEGENNTTTNNTVSTNTISNSTVNNTTTNTTSDNAATDSADIQINKGDKKKINQVVNLKRVPTIFSKEFDKIDINTEIEITDVINSWVKIKSTDKNGWVRIIKLKEALKEVQQASQEEVIKKETTENTTLAQTTKIGYVNADTLNLRETADKSSKIVKNLNKNQEVEILETADGWYKIKVANVIGYVAQKYISDTKVTVTSRASDEDRKTDNQSEENLSTQSESTPTTSSNKSGADVVALAEKYLKTKYVLGGSSPETGFDCSGFTSYVYGNFGVSLARTANGQSTQGTLIQKNELKVGDLLIFNNSGNTAVGHVGIYIGNNQFIHASNPSPYPVGGVKITSLTDSYYMARYVSARRVL